MKQLIPLLGAAALVGALSVSPLGCATAWAQASATGGGVIPGTNSMGVLTAPVVTPTDQGPAPASAPAGLPGTRSAGAPIAPDRPPSTLGPNEALFDAINRGDLAAARDAVSRGADLAAKNELGMSPTELAIDLGRNDITFLLLAQRGADRNVFGNQALPGPKAATGHGKPAKVAPVAAAPKPRATAPMREAAATPAAPAYGNAPGTPAPQDGFLGFGR